MADCNVNNRTIFNRDNLDVLRGINSECIDLIYLDPPFNKNKKFTAPIGSSARGAGFDDIFREEMVKSEWVQTIEEDQPELFTYLNGIKGVGKKYNFAYLAYMAIRVIECWRVLKPTGSVYLHCDPTMSHYLKTTMDCIFGEDNFRNEIVWRRTNAHNAMRKSFGSIHEILLFYTKTDNYTFEPGRTPYTVNYIETRFKQEDELGKYQLNYLTGPGVRTGSSGKCWRGFNPTDAGRHWAIPSSLTPYLPDGEQDSVKKLEALYHQNLIVFPKRGKQPMYKQYVGDGVQYQDIWAYQPNTSGVLFDSDACIDEDCKYLEGEQEKKVGYPTQKPLGLLNRIIRTSTNPDDIILDPFCGCATTCVAAGAFDKPRRWVGIDISHKAYDLVRERLDLEVARPDNIEQFRNTVHFTTEPPVRSDLGVDHEEKKYVYVISHPKYPREYKVGIAKDVKARLNSYQTSSPDLEYKLEFSLESSQFREIERHIHKIFENKHEWVTGDLKRIKDEIRKYESSTTRPSEEVE